MYIIKTSSIVAMFFVFFLQSMVCCHKLLTLRCPLVDVLVNIYANVKDAWKYVSSDGNNVRNGRVLLRPYVEHK